MTGIEMQELQTTVMSGVLSDILSSLSSLSYKLTHFLYDLIYLNTCFIESSVGLCPFLNDVHVWSRTDIVA